MTDCSAQALSNPNSQKDHNVCERGTSPAVLAFASYRACWKCCCIRLIHRSLVEGVVLQMLGNCGDEVHQGAERIWRSVDPPEPSHFQANLSNFFSFSAGTPQQL